FRVRLADANAPFKLFERRIWDENQEFIPRDALAPSLFLAVLVALRREGLIEIPVPHRTRKAGKGSLPGYALIRFCTRAFRQLLAFRRRTRCLRMTGS